MTDLRRFMQLVEDEAAAVFELDPALSPKNYVMTTSLRDVRNWKAKVWVGNSMRTDSDVKVGGMDQVGYVMVSLSTNHIIPIASSDEHHMGFDMLRALNTKLAKLGGGSINTRDYIPLWSYGNNYIYYESEAPKMLTVLTKWLAWGGPNGMLEGSSSMRGRAMTSKQFVAAKGKMGAVRPGKLAPIGTEIVKGYQKLAQALAMARQYPDKKSALPAAGKAALDLTKLFHTMGFLLSADLDDMHVMDSYPAQIKAFVEKNDEQGLSKLFFGYPSIKNDLHNGIRQQLAAKPGEYLWGQEKREAMWGDLKLAMDMLGRF